MHVKFMLVVFVLSGSGGEALEAVSTAVREAAKEAATGAWLAEFETGAPPRTLAPGLTHGLFGAWQDAEQANGSAKENLTQARAHGVFAAYNVQCTVLMRMVSAAICSSRSCLRYWTDP